MKGPAARRLASFAVLPGLLALPALPAGGQAPAVRAVVCSAPADAQARVFRLEREGDGWRLAFRSRETGGRWIRLNLPSAQPVFEADGVRLSYRNANGGRQIDLAVSSAGSSLDVWVDYGLDVNIEPDLDPRVDLMNTEGPLDGVRCTIESAR